MTRTESRNKLASMARDVANEIRKGDTPRVRPLADEVSNYIFETMPNERRPIKRVDGGAEVEEIVFGDGKPAAVVRLGDGRTIYRSSGRGLFTPTLDKERSDRSILYQLLFRIRQDGASLEDADTLDRIAESLDPTEESPSEVEVVSDSPPLRFKGEWYFKASNKQLDPDSLRKAYGRGTITGIKPKGRNQYDFGSVCSAYPQHAAILKANLERHQQSGQEA